MVGPANPNNGIILTNQTQAIGNVIDNSDLNELGVTIIGDNTDFDLAGGNL